MDGRVEIAPIGVLRSCFGGKFGAPRQPGLCPAAWGRLVFHEPFRDAGCLRGLDGFSHVWLVWHLHLTAARGWSPTVRPPRLGGNRRVGVFASRSTHRPNPLGLSLARLEGIDHDAPDGPALWLGGIDLIDGTPVFDIKPYLAYAEAPADARAGYAGDAIPRLQVAVSPAAAAAFDALPPRARALIGEALALDPRPATRAREGDPGRVYGAHLCGRNVRFRMDGEVCTIVEIASEGAPAAPPLPPQVAAGISPLRSSST